MTILKRIIAWIKSLFKKPGKVELEPLVWNPFLKYPRNESCYCGSDKKYKACCLNSEPPAIPESSATMAATLVKRVRKKK